MAVVLLYAPPSAAGYLESITDLTPTLQLLNAYLETVTETPDVELGGYTAGITESISLTLF